MSVNNLSVTLDASQRYELVSDVITTINVVVKDTMDLEIVGLADSKGTFLMNLYGEGTLNLTLDFGSYAKWSYLTMNRSDEKLVIEENVYLQQNAYIEANYGELSDGNHEKVSNFNLVGHHSHLEIRGATIAFKELSWKFNVKHEAKDSYAMVRNYGIVFEGGKLAMEVLGHILHGFVRSKTHQETRILNMEEDVKARVYPQLVIDENDVEASHAASVGQPDPEAIYYLQSRGLTYEKTLEVITLGYLLPIVDVIDDESIREQLTETIYEKVSR